MSRSSRRAKAAVPGGNAAMQLGSQGFGGVQSASVGRWVLRGGGCSPSLTVTLRQQSCAGFFARLGSLVWAGFQGFWVGNWRFLLAALGFPLPQKGCVYLHGWRGGGGRGHSAWLMLDGVI